MVLIGLLMLPYIGPGVSWPDTRIYTVQDRGCFSWVWLPQLQLESISRQVCSKNFVRDVWWHKGGTLVTSIQVTSIL